MICEVAPAKVNLTLEIVGKRNDGYHEIRSIMQTIDICDLLTFWDNDWIHILPEYCNLPQSDDLLKYDSGNYMGDNLVYRAAKILKEETGYKGGALIQLKKNIPSASGLGGGSSDAAATLKGLNKLWRLGLSNKQLAKLGARLGSDISFFIFGGTCMISGRGEKVIPLKPIPTKWLLILLIPMIMEEKTKKLYSQVDSSYYSSGEKTEILKKKIKSWKQKKITGISTDSANFSISKNLFNTFEIVYNNGQKCFDRWKKQRELLDIGPLHLAGSGPAVYYLSDEKEELIDMVDNRLNNFCEIKKYITCTVP